MKNDFTTIAKPSNPFSQLAASKMLGYDVNSQMSKASFRLQPFCCDLQIGEHCDYLEKLPINCTELVAGHSINAVV